jgi:hypothetical protein
MAFDATSPYALACLSDTAKAGQSCAVLQQQESPELRVQNLVELVHSWDVPMDEHEAEQVVSEFDRVLAAHGGSGRGAGSFSAMAALIS